MKPAAGAGCTGKHPLAYYSNPGTAQSAETRTLHGGEHHLHEHTRSAHQHVCFYNGLRQSTNST